MPTTRSYDELIADACNADFSGWDFSWIEDRVSQQGPSWNYDKRARELVANAQSLLDLDTGGGETLASFAPMPAKAVATERWGPNVPVATHRLQPLGCEVRQPVPGSGIPADNGEFDLALSRHGSLPVAELQRVLQPGGTVFTQQVGSRNCADLNEALGAPAGSYDKDWRLDRATQALSDAGFEVVEAREEFPPFTFFDIGALVYHLRVVSWQVPDFDIQTYDTALRRIDAQIRRDGSFTATDHRFVVEARRQ